MMSLLTRIAARAGLVPSRSTIVTPKGFTVRQPLPVFRAVEPDEEEERTAQEGKMARAITSAEDPASDDEEDTRAIARRAGEPPRDKEKEPVQLLRRAEVPEQDHDQEMAQPARHVRRLEETPLEEGEKPLRHPFQEDLAPGASALPPEMMDQKEPPALQAIRREAAPVAPASPGQRPSDAIAAPGAEVVGFVPSTVPIWHDGNAPAAAGYGGAQADVFDTDAGRPAFTSSERPQVFIDQVDVLIHEPAPPPARPAFDHARSLRARYLRRL